MGKIVKKSFEKIVCAVVKARQQTIKIILKSKRMY